MSYTGARDTTLVVSKGMQFRSHSQMDQIGMKMNEILGRQQQTDAEKMTFIRRWFAYYDLLDVTTMLELAIWRCNVDNNEQSAEARQRNCRNCGSDMNIIIPGVLPFLEG